MKPATRTISACAASVFGAVMMVGCGFDDLGIPACPSRLLPGQVVITEVLADPGSPEGEWIEIFNATGQAVDLRGTVLTVEGTAGEAPQRHVLRAARVEPGAYFVLGREGASAVPSAHLRDALDDALGDAPDALPDDGGRVSLRCDVIEVDAAVYPAAAPGVAVGLSGALTPDAAANDEPASWCAATQAFAPGRAGSPGAVNEVCPGVPGGGGPGTCEDHGTTRALVAPAVGDLVITEVMANPEAVSDAAGEWIELYAARDVDLNGLAVGAGADALDVIVADTACRRVAAGAHVVLAANPDPAANGGLGAVAGALGFSLRNSDGAVALGHGAAVLDAVAWASAPAGKSLALDPAHRSPADNDLAGHWCASTGMPYGSGDIGTPGAENGACAGAPGDAGPGDGTPGDAAPGDGAPPVPVSMCDDAGVMRPIVSPAPGAVRITEIMADPVSVSDSDGEWIEVRFDAAADLNGLELGKTPGQVLAVIEAPQCLAVPAGSHVVLARTTDPGRNGGLPRADAVLDIGLVNSGGALFVGARGAVLDAVTHGAATAGTSASLDEADGLTWCPSPADAIYGSGDRGTPGAANPACAVSAAVPVR